MTSARNDELLMEPWLIPSLEIQGRARNPAGDGTEQEGSTGTSFP